MRHFIVVGLLLGVAVAAPAQVCMGRASFAVGRTRAGAGIGLGDGVKTFAGGLTFGSVVGPFATVSVDRTEYDDIEDAGVGLDGSIGYSVPLNPQHTVALCPQIGAGYLTGPSIVTNAGTFETTGHGFTFGADLGGIAASTPSLDVIPTASATYVTARYTYTSSSTKIFETQSHTDVSLGVGFVLNRTVSLVPSISIPIGLEGGKTSFGVTFGFNF